jgi:sugar phosphate permease
LRTGKIHWAWFILAVSFATVFTNYSIRLSYGILMPEMIQSLRITKAQAGVIGSSFYVSYTIFSPLLGFLVDRLSARKLLMIFCLIGGTGTFLMGKPETLLQACLSFGLMGVGSAAMWTPVVTLVQRWFGERRRGLALGLLSISYTIGYGIMGLVLPPLVERYGWRTCWFILSGLAFALVPLNGFFVRNDPADMNLAPWGGVAKTAAEKKPTARIAYRELLKMPNLWLIGISYFFIGFTAYVVNMFLVTYGTLELKFPFPQAAKLASMVAFSGMIGAVCLPAVSDILGRKKCLTCINLFMTGSIALIIWAGARWVPLLLSVSLFGIFYAAVWPMYAAAAADYFPREATGSVLGFWTIFYGIGLILAPTLGGYIADVTGTFTRAFSLAIITGTIAAIFFAVIRKSEFSAR